MNFITKFCATLGAETQFERARLASTYLNTSPPEEEDIKSILKSLSGSDPETDRRIAFGSIVRKLRQSNWDEDGWILIIKNLIIIDRCVSDGILLKEFCELDLPNIEFRQEKFSLNKKLLLHELVTKYYNYIKLKSHKLRVTFSLSLYKKEKNVYFNQMSSRQIFSEITLILQFVTKAFDIIETKRCGHLKYQINQYLFLMILNDLFKYYACSLVGFNELLKRIELIELEELIMLAETTRLLLEFSVKLEEFINTNRFIKGFEYIDLEYKIQPQLVDLVVQYLNVIEQTKQNNQNKVLQLNTYTSKVIIEQIFQQGLTKQQSAYFESLHSPSRFQLYINQFKHKFDGNKFQSFKNNFSTFYTPISAQFKSSFGIHEEIDIDILELQENKSSVIEENIQFLYPEPFNEKQFIELQNIFHK